MKIPSVESHVKQCVKALGEEYRELCYMVNSWMDAPSRSAGAAHRIYRHDPINTPIEACRIYGETVDGAVLVNSRINDAIVFIVRQHLVLDGLLRPTDPIFSQTHQTLMVGSSGKRRIVLPLLTHNLSQDVAAHIKNMIQELENTLNIKKKDITLASLILLFALVALPFLFINLFGGPFAFDALILMSPLFIIIIGFPFIELLSAIKTYHSAEEFYQKLKEQEENGQIKCPVCEKKTAVLVKKQDSTFIVCKRCGFAWFYKSLLLLPHNDAVRILSGEFRVEGEKVYEKCPRTGEMKNKPDECEECEYLMYKAVIDKAGCEWTLWKCTFEKKEGE